MVIIASEPRLRRLIKGEHLFQCSPFLLSNDIVQNNQTSRWAICSRQDSLAAAILQDMVMKDPKAITMKNGK